MNNDQIARFTDEHKLPKWECGEAVEVEKIREAIKNGDPVPDEVVRRLKIIDAIDLAKLVNTTPDKPLHAYLRDAIKGIKKFTIDTGESRVEIHFNEENAHGGAISYPTNEDGERLFLDAMMAEAARKPDPMGIGLNI